MVNKVFLIGRLGKDPVVKHFQNDNAIAEFPLATTEVYKDREGNWKEITDWHNIKINGKYGAERAEKSLKKGSMVFIEGKIKTRSYDDKDGNKRYVTEVVVDQFRMLDKRNEGGSEGGGNTYPTNTTLEHEQPSAPASGIDDDLPF